MRQKRTAQLSFFEPDPVDHPVADALEAISAWLDDHPELLEAVAADLPTFHDDAVRNVAARSIQCDEIWAFCYAKQKNVARTKAVPPEAGDIWTWTAIDESQRINISLLARFFWYVYLT